MNDIPHRLFQAIFFVFPFILAGAIHIIVIKKNLLSRLAHVPLDFQLTVRGRRLFGKNKTLRGAVVVIGGVMFGVLLQAALIHIYPASVFLFLVNYHSISPLAWGFFLGAGCVIGELPNSFLKRQFDIPPGGYPLRPFLKATTWMLDQLDSVIGILLFASAIISVPLLTILLVVCVSLLIHPMGALVMVRLGLKTHT